VGHAVLLQSPDEAGGAWGFGWAAFKCLCASRCMQLCIVGASHKPTHTITCLQSFWDKPKVLMDEEVPYSDETSAALAEAAEAAKRTPLELTLGGEAEPMTRARMLEAMRRKNPKGA
jgi:hypothetical protein